MNSCPDFGVYFVDFQRFKNHTPHLLKALGSSTDFVSRKRNLSCKGVYHKVTKIGEESTLFTVKHSKSGFNHYKFEYTRIFLSLSCNVIKLDATSLTKKYAGCTL